MRSTLLRHEAWRRATGRRGRPGSLGLSPAGGTEPDGVGVEMFLGGGWVNIMPFVYRRARISITRGRADESSQTQASTCRFTVKNPDGRFSPRKADGPYYGQIGRNTPVRIFRVVGGVRRYRFHGEVSSWPSSWNTSGTDVYVPLECAGVLRRLNQGNSPLRSTMYRGVTSASNVVDYWPMEDLSGAESLGSGNGGVPMAITGSPALGNSEIFASSAALPDIGTGTLTAKVRRYVPLNSGGAWRPNVSESLIQCLFQLPAAGLATGAVIMRIRTTGTIARTDISCNADGSLQTTIYDGAGVAINSSTDGEDRRGDLVVTGVEFVQGPTPPGTTTTAQVTTVISRLGGEPEGGAGALGTSQSIGIITQIQINPAGADMTGLVLGHLWVQNISARRFALGDQATGYNGEAAGRRFERLCAEEGVEFHGLGDLDETAAMGPQRPDDLVKLLNECSDTDMGISFEPKDAFGLGYVPRRYLYNQAARLALNYSTQLGFAELTPVDDDQQARNDVTVTRPNGSSARAVLETGPMSVLPPRLGGIGRYDQQVPVNVQSDDDLIDQAGWRLFVGTVDEARYPKISLYLHHPVIATDTELLTAALLLEAGERITVDDLPEWLPPDQVSQLAQGFSEVITETEHTLTVNCAPESPYRVAVTDDPLTRAGTDGSTLVGDVGPTATSILVATTNPRSPLWTTVPAHFPFDIRVGGEVMTVNSITGTSSPQLFDDVTRSVNGVVKPQVDGTAVGLAQPAILGL